MKYRLTNCITNKYHNHNERKSREKNNMSVKQYFDYEFKD